MGVREWMNRHPQAVGWATGAFCIVVLGAMAFQLRTGDGPRGPSMRDFYSSDDGKSWFSADAGQRSPIDKGGHAYRVYVWKCLTDGKLFVSHLERAIGPPGKAGPSDQRPASSRGQDVEVRKPGTGDTGWVKASSDRGVKVTAPICPDGHTDIEPVEP